MKDNKQMRVLFVDTTTPDLVVAVVRENSIDDFSRRNLGTKHSETLCQCVSDALKQCNLSFDDFDAYACAIGPGSFTGIRIGIATVKGYALAVPKPVIAVNCLESIANSATCGKKGCAIINAGNGYYFADYKRGVAPTLIPFEDEQAKCAGSCIGAADCVDGSAEIIRRKFAEKQFDSALSPLYIRRSQAEEKWKN